ncbi:hypothetical protein TNCV_1250651 [Trichonephila clavipes]|nr:hypothetical protein TNCV_1250651 [Trichonephila clavipes]
MGGGTCAESRSLGRTCCKKVSYALPSKELGRRMKRKTRSSVLAKRIYSYGDTSGVTAPLIAPGGAGF